MIILALHVFVSDAYTMPYISQIFSMFNTSFTPD